MRPRMQQALIGVVVDRDETEERQEAVCLSQQPLNIERCCWPFVGATFDSMPSHDLMASPDVRRRNSSG